MIAALAAVSCARAPQLSAPEPNGVTLPPQAFHSDLAPLHRAIAARLVNEPGEYGIAVIDLETAGRPDTTSVS